MKNCRISVGVRSREMLLLRMQCCRPNPNLLMELTRCSLMYLKPKVLISECGDCEDCDVTNMTS